MTQTNKIKASAIIVLISIMTFCRFVAYTLFDNVFNCLFGGIAALIIGTLFLLSSISLWLSITFISVGVGLLLIGIIAIICPIDRINRLLQAVRTGGLEPYKDPPLDNVQIATQEIDINNAKKINVINQQHQTQDQKNDQKITEHIK